MRGEVLTKAASGDVRSLREMASMAQEASEGRDHSATLICLAEALTFSRLAASSGSKAARRNVVALLADIADELFAAGDRNATSFSVQALVVARQMAAEGDNSLRDFIANNPNLCSR